MADLRSLPQVDSVLRDVAELAGIGPVVARRLVRREIDAARDRVLAGGQAGDVRAAVARAVDDLTSRRVRRVINATGVLMHTNLGRAPLSEEATAAVVQAAGAAALEFDLATGRRAQRAPVAATLVAALCEADDALVVNNNAGALLLILAALAHGREVIVSRGELIEIGGEFRLPDVMTASRALLREVGTTNRTHPKDYRAALNERTAMILKVHPSNYRIVGFTAQPSVDELAGIAHAQSIPLIDDIGSGLLRPEEGALADEPDAASALAAGADLVCFSGDKLLGGPQAGIIAGRSDLIESCRRNPIARAVRADKLTLAALEVTLWAYARGEPATIPVHAMLQTSHERVAERARALVGALPPGVASIVEGESVPGGGSAPGSAIPTALVVIHAGRAEQLAAALRGADPPVVARVDRDTVVIDLRTVAVADDPLVIEALEGALSA